MDLHNYQKYAVTRICEQKKIALFLDLGLGKTIVSLKAIEKLIADGEIKNALVIAPKTVVETVWKQEAEAWNLPLRVVLVTGTPTKREILLKEEADIHVVSRDSMAWLFTQEFHADMLIVDESTSFKDRSTQRWASLCQKTIHVAGKKKSRKQAVIEMFSRVVLLSATPASETYAGLWAQIALLFPKNNPLGKTIGEFRERYMKPRYFGNSIFPQWVDMKPGAIEQINDILKPIAVSMKKEDWLQLPERTDIVRNINTKNICYEFMSKNGVVDVDGETIIAENVLSKYNKLQQLSSGFIYDEHGKIHIVNHEKEQALNELLECSQENILVIYRFEYEKKFVAGLGGVTLDNPDAITKWKQGKIRIGMLYPASGGFGLNLASGGCVVVWYSLPLSLEEYIQTNGRIHRQGQTKNVRIYHLLATPIDGQIYALLKAKKEVLNGLMEVLKHEEH